MTALFLALALAAAQGGEGDPCAPVAPAAAPDPESAAAYRAVAEGELARGDRAAAAVAYRAAAALEAGDAGARAALASLCAAGPLRDPFADGVALLDAGDPRGALRALRASHAGRPAPPATALLEAICHYDLGEDAAAEPLLRVAETSPVHRGTARLYLGLLRLRAGDASGAAALLDAAGEGAALGGLARDLARAARRDGKLVLSLLAESGWDSNVTLAPRGGVPGPEADGAFGITGALVWRPLGRSGPYVRGIAGVTEQLSLAAYDFVALDAAAGWQHATRSLTLAAEYDLASRTLGGASYLTAHRLLGSAVLTRGGVALGATYAARLEDYAGLYADYSGVTHRAELRLSVPLGRAARLALAYGGARDLADAADLSFLEHGPRAELLVALGARARLGLEGGATLREYDAADGTLAPADPGFGLVRDDTHLDAAVFGELDLGAHLTARATLQARRVRSTRDDLEYEKLVPFVGLLWVAGR